MIVRFALHPSHLRLRTEPKGENTHLDFFCFQRLHQSPDNSCERIQNMDRRCMTQTELAEHYQISEAKLKRWRTAPKRADRYFSNFVLTSGTSS